MAGRQLDVHVQVSGEQLNLEMNVGESGAEMVFQAIRLDQIIFLQMISSFQNCFSCPCRFEIYVLFFFFFKLFTLSKFQEGTRLDVCVQVFISPPNTVPTSLNSAFCLFVCFLAFYYAGREMPMKLQ